MVRAYPELDNWGIAPAFYYAKSPHIIDFIPIDSYPYTQKKITFRDFKIKIEN